MENKQLIKEDFYNILDRINLLNESADSKSQDKARKLAVQHGMSSEEAHDFVHTKLRNDLPLLRNKKCAKFTYAIARMFFDGELTDAKTIGAVNNMLKYAASDENYSKYDQNLNGLTAKEFINEFQEHFDSDKKSEKDKTSSQEYEDKGYTIKMIETFTEAKEYGDYTSWCVTHDGSMWRNYTNNNHNQFYFCLKDGFEDTPKEVGNNCPLDEYGLSMIAVCVNPEGEMETCTCRWNHDHSGNDHIMTESQISEVVGKNFYDTFLPNDTPDIDDGVGMDDDSWQQIRFENAYTLLTDNSGNSDYFFMPREDNDRDTDPYSMDYAIYDSDLEMVDFGHNYYSSDDFITNNDGKVAVLRYQDQYDIFMVDYQGYMFSTTCDDYKIDDEFDLEFPTVFALYNGDILYSDDEFYSAFEATKQTSETLNNISTIYIEGEKMFQIPNTKNEGTFDLFKDDQEKIIEAETPEDGRFFDLTEGEEKDYILCQSGNAYDMDGNMIDVEGNETKPHWVNIFSLGNMNLVKAKGNGNYMYNIMTADRELVFENPYNNSRLKKTPNGKYIILYDYYGDRMNVVKEDGTKMFDKDIPYSDIYGDFEKFFGNLYAIEILTKEGFINFLFEDGKLLFKDPTTFPKCKGRIDDFGKFFAISDSYNDRYFCVVSKITPNIQFIADWIISISWFGRFAKTDGKVVRLKDGKVEETPYVSVNKDCIFVDKNGNKSLVNENLKPIFTANNLQFLFSNIYATSNGSNTSLIWYVLGAGDITYQTDYIFDNDFDTSNRLPCPQINGIPYFPQRDKIVPVRATDKAVPIPMLKGGIQQAVKESFYSLFNKII